MTAMFSMCQVGGALPGFPGQSGNPVGFAATPASAPPAFTIARGQIWPGPYPGSLTAWPGGTGNQTISNGTHATSGSGTSGDPWIFAFYDFNAGTGTTTITVSNAIFVGCRFQSNNVGNDNVQIGTGANVTFIYFSIVPLVSLAPTIPNAAWPSAGAGLGIVPSSINYHNFNIPQASGYQFGVTVSPSGGPYTFDHGDMWGFANAFNLVSATTATILIQDTWIHDGRNDAALLIANANGSTGSAALSVTTTPAFPAVGNQIRDATQGYALVGNLQSFTGGALTLSANALIAVASGDILAVSSVDHTDGPGYLNAGTPPINVQLRHNTIATIGNTNALAFQGGTSNFTGYVIDQNYLSGFGNPLFLGNTSGSGIFASSSVTNNVLGTDLPWVNSPTHGDLSTVFSGNGNEWSNNRLNVLSGTSPAAGSTPSWTSANNGQFILPSGTFSMTDF